MKQISMMKRTARMAIMLILAMLTTQSVLAADKTALAAAIGEAETYYSSIQESNPSEAGVLTTLINACKEVQDNADAQQEDVDFATAFMNESVKQCKIAVAQANYAAAISDAEAYFATIKDNYPAQAEKLNTVINNAKTFMENTSVDVLEILTQSVRLGIEQMKLEVAQADYAAAIAQAEEYLATIQEGHPTQAETLTTVINNAKTFTENTQVDVLNILTQVVKEAIKQIQLEIAQADLAAAISDAEAYLATIQESNPSVATAMQFFIDAAKQVQADDSYTQADLEFATGCMKELVVQAKDIVTTGVSAPRAASAMAGKLFDLQGRQVQQPAHARVYINNGKKFANK